MPQTKQKRTVLWATLAALIIIGVFGVQRT